MSRASYVMDEAITVSTSSIPLTTIPTSCSEAVVECQVAAVRYALDGGAPTASVGHVLEVGDVLTLDSADQVTKFRAIRRDGADATLYVSYGRGD